MFRYPLSHNGLRSYRNCSACRGFQFTRPVEIPMRFLTNCSLTESIDNLHLLLLNSEEKHWIIGQFLATQFGFEVMLLPINRFTAVAMKSILIVLIFLILLWAIFDKEIVKKRFYLLYYYRRRLIFFCFVHSYQFYIYDTYEHQY